MIGRLPIKKVFEEVVICIVAAVLAYLPVVALGTWQKNTVKITDNVIAGMVLYLLLKSVQKFKAAAVIFWSLGAAFYFGAMLTVFNFNYIVVWPAVIYIITAIFIGRTLLSDYRKKPWTTEAK